MATDLFLCRKNGRFFKYEAVEALSQTGAIETYSGVTGVNATGVVTISGATLSDGLQITFSQKTGGSNLTTGRTYFARDCSGATCKLAEYIGGAALNLGSDITDGNVLIQSDELRVWSAEYRDIFQSTFNGSITALSYVYAASATVPGTLTNVDSTIDGTPQVATQTPVIGSQSDELAHQPLRQTMLPRTHWKFDMGSSVSPRYLYAEWQTGDAVTPNPPNTI